MSVKQWIKTLVLIAIPIVNLIFLFQWGFGRDNPRKNYSRAFLMIFSSFIGLLLIFGVLGSLLNFQIYHKQTQPSYDFMAVEEYEKEVETDLNNNLQLLDVSIQKDNSGSNEIVGKVRNNSTTKTYSNFVITCNVYDIDNTILQTVDIVINDTIPQGETLKFSEWKVDPTSSSVKSIKIRSKTILD